MTASPQDLSAEQILLPLIAADDSQAFNALVRMHASILVGYASRLLQSQEMAEDVVQDVFCRIWDQRATIVRCQPIRAYLLGAVRNASIDALRHLRTEEKWEAIYEQEDQPPGMSTPSPDLDDALIRSELAKALERAVDQLPERRRQILLLRLKQLTYSEIAQALEISSKTVEAQITQAFMALRKALGPWAE